MNSIDLPLADCVECDLVDFAFADATMDSTFAAMMAALQLYSVALAVVIVA